MLPRPFAGVIAAPFLPMREGGAIDWPALEAYMDWIAGQGPDAIAMNMDASEVVALDHEEEIEVLKVARAAIAGRAPLVSGLVAGSTRAAARKAETLARHGAEGFAVFPPLPTFAGQPVPAEMLHRFHAAVADAAKLPIICFQFPKGWGPDYTPEILERMAEIDELVAIKEASFDIAQTLSTIEAAAALDRPIGVLTGSDTFIFEALAMGCGGALIGFAGTATRELVEMQRAVAAGDLARGRAIWARLAPLARQCWRPPIRDFRPRMKEVLRWQGLFPESACREPQLGVSEAERAAIARLCEAAGLERS